MSVEEVRVGQVWRDNDPRAKLPEFTVERVVRGFAYVRRSNNQIYRISLQRMRSQGNRGYSLVSEERIVHLSSASASKPAFQPVDLTELMTAGVLLRANESFFWPLGLALTWTWDDAAGVASNLHVREWVYPDGHVESIGKDMSDPIYDERQARWQEWATTRVLRFRDDDERERAMMVGSIVSAFLGPTPTANEGG